MYDHSFNKKTISKQFKRKDFSRFSSLLSNQTKVSDVIEKAVSYSSEKQNTHVKLKTYKYKKNNIYNFTNIEQELVLRKASNNILKLTSVNQTDRNKIISDLKTLLSENIQYKVYKLDIKKFYDNIDTASIIERLTLDVGVPRPTTRIICNFLKHYSDTYGKGLPRGLSISASLSELHMRNFDKEIRKLENVFYYNRYVDDMIIITSGTESSSLFLSTIEETLPSGLNLNKLKQKTLDSKKLNNRNRKCLLNYLGYEFTVHHQSDNATKRNVQIDISLNKSNSIKTKCIKAYLDFIKNNKLRLFEIRIRFLTSNYTFYDVETSTLRMSGIYFNYKKIDFESTKRLKGLDQFLRNLMYSKKIKLSKNQKFKFGNKARSTVLKYSFERGFEKKIIYSFSADEVKTITECWRHD